MLSLALLSAIAEHFVLSCVRAKLLGLSPPSENLPIGEKDRPPCGMSHKRPRPDAAVPVPFFIVLIYFRSILGTGISHSPNALAARSHLTPQSFGTALLPRRGMLHPSAVVDVPNALISTTTVAGPGVRASGISSFCKNEAVQAPSELLQDESARANGGSFHMRDEDIMG